MDATNLGNLTVPELQQECKRRGLKKGGIKIKLIQRLAEHIEKYGPDAVVPPPSPVLQTVVEKEVHPIENSHPYMAEYEQQLIDNANLEADMEYNSGISHRSSKEMSQDENSINKGMNNSAEDVMSSNDCDLSNHRPNKEEEEGESMIKERSNTSKTHTCEQDEEEDELFNYVAERDANDDTSELESQPSEYKEDMKDEEDSEDVGVEGNEEKPGVKDLDVLVEGEGAFMEGEGYIEETVEKMSEEHKDGNNVREDLVESTKADESIENWGEMRDGDDGSKIEEDWGTLKENNEVSMVDDWDKIVDDKENTENACSTREIVDGEEVEVETNKKDQNDSDKFEDGEITVADESQNEFAENNDDSDHLDIMIRDKIIEDVENDEFTVKQKAPKKIVVPVSLKKRVSLIASTESVEEKAAKRKRRWGATATLKDTSVPISSESIKKLIPDMKIDAAALENVPELDYIEEDVVDEMDDLRHTIDDSVGTVSPVKVNKGGRTVKVDAGKKITFNKTPAQEIVTVESDSVISYASIGEVIKPLPAQPVRTYMLEDDVEIQEEREKSPSPAQNPISPYIYIDNLVRPYTINQLKSLVRRTGNICDQGFWINNIKSHCYVKLSSEKEASATREALHGIRWPPGSPKVLKVDFAVNEKMYAETESFLGEKAKIVIEIEDKENDPVVITNEYEPRKESPEERRSRNERIEIKERRAKRISKDQEAMKVSEKDKRHDDREESPAKRLEDLFKKTKATPCIYWLPLTEKQILERERQAEMNRETKDVNHDRSHDMRDRTHDRPSYDRNTDRRSQQFRANRSWR